MKNEKPIAHLREKAGLTQAELADVVGVSENTIANWEKGKASKWIRHLYKLCQTLNCKLEDLEPGLKSDSLLCPLLTETVLDAVKSYCIARENGEKKAEAKIASYAALHDKQLQYWLNQADQVIEQSEYNTRKATLSDVVVNTLKLENLVNQLCCNPPEDINYEKFCELVKQVVLSREFIEQYISFDNKSFKRTLILKTWALTVYVIGWRPEQTSGMHHHGNSFDAIYVVEGEMNHRLLSPEECHREQIPYENYPLEENNKGRVETVTEGNFTFVNCRHGHQITNLTNKKLVTLIFRFGVSPEDERWDIQPREKNPSRQILRWGYFDQGQVVLPYQVSPKEAQILGN